MIEFFWSPNSNKLMVHDIHQGEVNQFSEYMHELIDKVYYKLKEEYPDTWHELKQEYSRGIATSSYEDKFKIVNRFLKCNFSAHDNQPDIDDDFNFEFEMVPCPLRGECTRGYCTPKLSTCLTKREKEIVPYLVDGYTHQEIGDLLYVSGITIKNHTFKIYQKLGFTGKPHPERLLIKYAYKNNIIEPNA